MHTCCPAQRELCKKWRLKKANLGEYCSYKTSFPLNFPGYGQSATYRLHPSPWAPRRQLQPQHSPSRCFATLAADRRPRRRPAVTNTSHEPREDVDRPNDLAKVSRARKRLRRSPFLPMGCTSMSPSLPGLLVRRSNQQRLVCCCIGGRLVPVNASYSVC